MLGLSSSFSSYLHAPASGPFTLLNAHSNHSHYQSTLQVLSGPDKTPKQKAGAFATSLSSTGRTKLEKKAMRCIFTGYDEQKKGWRSHPTTNKAYVSPHVVFDEASSWWSTENVVLPDSESLDTSMRAQLPERQEVSVGSDSKPVESQKQSSRTGSSLRAPFDRRQVFARFKVKSP